jgi:hypothetical protein
LSGARRAITQYVERAAIEPVRLSGRKRAPSSERGSWRLMWHPTSNAFDIRRVEHRINGVRRN